LTTVGYGDVYPITLGGRLFTSIILVLGLGVVAVPTGLLASALSKAREIESVASPKPRQGDEAAEEEPALGGGMT
jgi:voltage-gated potassium channel